MNKNNSKPNSRTQLQRLADFLFEAGMLRKTPRTGYQFLGTGSEDVAQHSFRVAIIGFTLAKLAEANMEKVLLLCLFHDFAEARTGDFNYVNHIYNTANTFLALKHSTAGTGFEADIADLHSELCAKETLESQLAHDADQLDLILNLKEELDLGNIYAEKWLVCANKRLVTPHARELAETIAATDHADWWHLTENEEWWVKGKKE